MKLKPCTIGVLALAHAASVVSYLQADGPAQTDQLYESLASKKGSEYVEARDALVSMGPEAVQFIEERKAQTSDTIEKLVLDSLLARSRDPQRLDNAIREAFEAVEATAHMSRMPGMRNPKPLYGAMALMQNLGDDALPFATELFTKGLTQDWEMWQKEVLMGALGYLGIPRGPNGRMVQTRDSRGGELLLWLIEHDQDEAIAVTAGRALRGFAAEPLLAKVRSALDQTEADARQKILNRTARGMEFDLRQSAPQAGATQPATTPSDALWKPVTTSLPFRFALDPGRELSPPDQAELNRLIAIASDAEESVDRRTQAVILLGERGAHLDCIQPLRQIVDTQTEPEALRIEAIVALSRIPDKSVVPVLLDILEYGETPRIRSAAFLSLERLHHAGAVDYGGGTGKKHNVAVEWWRNWWAENQETFVPDPDRIGTVLKIP